MSLQGDLERIMDSTSVNEDNSCTTNRDEKCRLCLKGNGMLIPVSSENLEGGVVALQIDILTSVKVAPADKICTVCRLKIKKFYAFRVMCLRSDARIRGKSKLSQGELDDEEAEEEDEEDEGDDDDVGDIHNPGLCLPDSVSVMRVHGDNIRSYKRQRKVEANISLDMDTTWKQSSEGLSITPLPVKSPKKENGMEAVTKREVSDEEYENGQNVEQNGGESNKDWEHVYGSDRDGNSHSHRDSEAQGDETENLEVQIDPFMLMADECSDPEPQSTPVNVRGHILYPILGQLRNLAQKSVLPAPRRSDKERALELIKQMTATRKTSTAGDGSFLDKPFKCDMCPESFSYYKSFIKHKQRHTGEAQTFSCEFCSETFHTSRLLQNHLKYHNIEKAFPCDQCERSFPTKERLQSHYTIHTGNKPFVCEICNKSFAYKSSYGLHIRKQHGELPIKSQSFKCDKCPQEYDIFGDLKRHLRTHLGEKPFTCQVCNKAFASKSILNVHSRIHNGFKPYRCEICKQSFTQKQSLDYHMRRHSEENPFKCEHCGMTFQRRHFLDKHVEVQHGGAPANSNMIQFGGRNERDDGLDLVIDEEACAEMEEGEEQDDDDDMDSDPLRLEIVESTVKVEADESSDSIKGELTE